MEKRVESARSQSDGIIFYSNQIPLLGIRSMVTEDGQFFAGPTCTLFEDIFGFLGGDKLRRYVIDDKNVMRLNALLVLLAFMTSDIWIIFGTVYFVIFAGKHTYQLISFVFAMKLGDARGVGRFHSAEHMVINAYNSLKRIPSIEEISSYSRYSDACGSRKLIRQALIYTVISLEIMTIGRMSVYIYIAALVLTSVLIQLIERNKWYRYFQVLVTNKPTQTELMVAYNGIVAFDKMESDIESECIESFVMFY